MCGRQWRGQPSAGHACDQQGGNQRARRKAALEERPGAGKHLASIVRQDRGHNLYAFTLEGMPGVICTTCGTHASRMHNSMVLLCTCLRKATARGGHARRRFDQGLHPDPRFGAFRLEGRWRLKDQCFEMEEQGDDM